MLLFAFVGGGAGRKRVEEKREEANDAEVKIFEESRRGNKVNVSKIISHDYQSSKRPTSTSNYLRLMPLRFGY